MNDLNLGTSKLGRPGGRRVKGQGSNNATLGRGRDYWIARLQRDGHADLLDAIQHRQISAYGAAVKLGWAKRRPLVSQRRHDDGNDDWTTPRPIEVEALIG